MFKPGDILKIKKPISYDSKWRYVVMCATELQVCYAYMDPETGAIEHLYLDLQFLASEQLERV